MTRARRAPSGPARLAACALLLAALPGASGCAFALVSGGQVRPAPFEDLVSRTVRARGLAPTGEIRTRVVSAGELPGILRQALAADWTGAEIESYQEGLTTLGLWPPDRDLADEFIAVYAEEIAGLYLPSERTLYLVDDLRSPWSLRLLSLLMRRDLERELILSHELVHLLQHQAFPSLMDPDPYWKAQGDAASALQAAIEGDALHYGFAALEIDPPAAEDVLSAMQEESAARSQGALADAPALLRLTVSFPYAYGYGLSLREGRALLTAPPASTEQVLHPDLRHADFQAIDLAALRATLPGECEIAFEDTLGELGISVLLRDLDAIPDPAAWEGWDGDRWLAARCAGQRELIWITAWDAESDAAEFAAAWERIAQPAAERAGMAAPPVAQRDGRDVVIATPRFAPLALRLASAARRARVASLAELRAHFEPGSGAGNAGAAAVGDATPPEPAAD